MYEVVGMRGSRAFRVLWMLEELGVPYAHIPAKPRSPEAIAAVPSGKVPALRVDGVVVPDSVAIMTYLADKHGALTHPAGTIERAHQDAWTHRIIEELDAVLWAEGKQRYFAPEEERIPALNVALKAEFARNLNRFEHDFTGPFVCGDAILLPDLLLAHCLGWAMRFEFPAPGPKLAAFAERMAARPAWQAAAAKP